MLPTTPFRPDPTIPADATYWVPKPSDIDEEGFGFFRDVWPIVGANVYETRTVIAAEGAALRALISNPVSLDAFELLVSHLERQFLQDRDLEIDESVADLNKYWLDALGSDWSGLEALELGVAGLTYALSCAGFFPAASCRGHNGDFAWSDRPVVLFAADQARVDAVAPYVTTAKCGFAMDDARPDLLCIEASSVWDLHALAEKIFDDRAVFRRLPKTNRRRLQGRRSQDSASTLF